MEPNKLSYGTELPEPLGESNQEASAVSSPEIVTNQNQPSISASQPLPPPSIPLSYTPPQPAAATFTQQPSTDSPVIADDSDLIEKEWVIKAKAIVAQTAHDPNLQTKELGKVKSDYLKKRYNKNLKLDES